MRLIDADALERKIAEMQDKLETDNDVLWASNKYIHKGLAQARRFLLDAPTVDAFAHAHWLQREDGTFCSRCRCFSHYDYDYCPNCGARMDGDTDAND